MGSSLPACSPASSSRSGADEDVVAIEHESADRIVHAVATAVPLGLLFLAAWRAWGGALHWQDLAVLGITYFLTCLGISVGFHRLFTHRSFKTSAPVRAVLAILGSAAVEGSVIGWVSTHRMHHSFSDQEGDPHSPHVGHGTGWLGALRGLAFAHLGWMFRGEDRANPKRYARDLLADPVVRFVSRTFPLWVVAGLALPFGLGVALTGTVGGGLTGLLWGGAVRIFLLHHATFSINSLCHFFGKRRFETGDRSRNLLWLAIPTMGEAWHNNHHAFPTSARHGLGPHQPDPSAWIIGRLERLGLVWNVVRVSSDRQLLKRVGEPAARA